MKIEPIARGDRKVYSVAAFNRGVRDWLTRLPTVWIEGEVTELRRHANWQTVFFTLKDPAEGACLAVAMARGQFDALRLDLADGAEADRTVLEERLQALQRRIDEAAANAQAQLGA